MNLRGAPDLMWAAFPQAQQPGGVVDLAVGENNAPICVPRSTPALFNSGVWAICWLISGEALHSTHSLPLSLTIIDDWVRGSLNGAIAQTLTVGAVAVPLRETAAGGGTEDFNEHEDGPGNDEGARANGGRGD